MRRALSELHRRFLPLSRLVLLIPIIEIVNQKVLIINIPIKEPEYSRKDEPRDGAAHKRPYQMRIRQGRDKPLTDCRRDGTREQEERNDHAPHIPRCARIRQFVRRHERKHLRQRAQHVDRDLGPDWDRGDAVSDSAACSVIPARRGLVDPPLQDRADDLSRCGEAEAKGNSLDGVEADVVLAERRIDPVTQDGRCDDDGQRVEVGEEVVRSALGGHSCGLGVENVSHAYGVQLQHREEDEDLTGGECSADFLHEGVIVVDCLPVDRGDSLLGEVRWLRSVEIVSASETAETVLAHGDSDHAQEQTKDVALRRELDGALVSCDEDERHQKVNYARQEVREPVANALLGVCGCKSEERAHVCQG